MIGWATIDNFALLDARVHALAVAYFLYPRDIL